MLLLNLNLNYLSVLILSSSQLLPIQLLPGKLLMQFLCSLSRSLRPYMHISVSYVSVFPSSQSLPWVPDSSGPPWSSSVSLLWLSVYSALLWWSFVSLWWSSALLWWSCAPLWWPLALLWWSSTLLWWSSASSAPLWRSPAPSAPPWWASARRRGGLLPCLLHPGELLLRRGDLWTCLLCCGGPQLH